MIIKPKYPKEIIKNPFYLGIIIGFIFSAGIFTIFYSMNLPTYLYGTGLLTLGIIYYYIKEKEFNEGD